MMGALDLINDMLSLKVNHAFALILVFSMLLSLSLGVFKKRQRDKLKSLAKKRHYDNENDIAFTLKMKSLNYDLFEGADAYKSIEKEIAKKNRRGFIRHVLRIAYAALDDYVEILRKLGIFYIIFINVAIFLAVFVYIGFNLGYLISVNLENVGVRDISYGIGIAVAGGLSFLATESGRHNKKHEITEKSLSSLRDVAGVFCQKVGEVKHLSKRAGELESKVYNHEKWERPRNEKEKDLAELKIELIKAKGDLEKDVNEVVTHWNIFEICYESLSDGKRFPRVYNLIKSNVDDLSGAVPLDSDHSLRRCRNYSSKIDAKGLMKFVSSYISSQHRAMKKDYVYLSKVSVVCLFAFLLLGVYMGYVGGKGGVLDGGFPFVVTIQNN